MDTLWTEFHEAVTRLEVVSFAYEFNESVDASRYAVFLTIRALILPTQGLRASFLGPVHCNWLPTI